MAKQRYNIFLNYRRDPGRNFARTLQQAFKARGYSVFFDYDSLRDGEFNNEIFTAIENCDVFVASYSKSFFDRCNDKGDWVRLELEHALKLGKKIVPVAPTELYNSLVFPQTIPDSLLPLKTLETTEIHTGQYFDESIDRCIKERFPKPFPKTKALGIGCAILIALMAVGLCWFAKNPNESDKAPVDHVAGENTNNIPPRSTEMVGDVPPVDERMLTDDTEPDVSPQDLPTANSTWSVFLPNGVIMEFAPCKQGLFKMGSPDTEQGRDVNEALHSVVISKPFWMGVTEVTQGQWESIMGTTVIDLAKIVYEDNTPLRIGDKTVTNRELNEINNDEAIGNLCGDVDSETAMYNVSWDDATNFCAKLTEQERLANRLPKGYAFRLPTEAEWEYAARAGSSAALPNGRNLDIFGCRNAPPIDSQGWYSGNSSVGFSGTGVNTSDWSEKQYPEGFAHARQVGQKEPNTWGLYDTIGNVFEWCNDWYERDYPIHEGVSWDPKGPPTGERHVLRGGSWKSFVMYCRLANRRGGLPNRRTTDYGFRVALGPEL